MLNSKNFSYYTTIAQIYSDENIEVTIAYKGENNNDNLYVINRFPHIKENNDLFTSFFSYFSSKDKIGDFVDFFTFEKHFYIVFKHLQCENIKTKFCKELCTIAYDDRCKILDSILMKIYRISKMPQNALICATETNNINIDEKNDIYINYDLRNIFKYKCINDFSIKNMIFNNIHEAIFTILQREAESKFNKPLHIVLRKCKNGMYSSIPELTVDLNRAEINSQNYSFISYMLYQFNLHKGQILKYSNAFLAVVIVIGIVMLIKQQLNQNDIKIQGALPAISIGGVKYNTNGDDESSKEVDTKEEGKKAKKTSYDNIVIPTGIDIEYEDYIIQYGDTVASICESHYQDNSFVTPVSTFNDIEINEPLVAGSILKLPNRTAIALYISN